MPRQEFIIKSFVVDTFAQAIVFITQAEIQ